MCSACASTARCIGTGSRTRRVKPSHQTWFCATHSTRKIGPRLKNAFVRLLFEKPEEFWNLPKLQEVYKTDRTPSLREILAKIFGIVPNIPSLAELADEAFEKFVTTQDTSAVHSRELRTVFVAFLLDSVSRKLVEQGKFPDLRARDANLYGALSALPVSEREALVCYLQTEVSLQDFDKAA